MREAVKQRRLSQVRAQAMAVLADTGLLVDGDDRLTAFERALPSIWMAFQPVVRWPENEIYGYEALLRSNDAALPSPGAMLDAAAHLGRLPELGRAVRNDVARQCLAEGGTAQIFVNLHPLDLLDESLYASDAPLSQLASRVVLEITERATLDGIKDLQARLTKLRGLGFRVALDDLGAGYSGLSSFAQLEPEVVKLDMSLVRDVHRSPTKQKLIRSMVGLCGELGSLLLAEGIETVEERDMVASLGCGLMQGYLFARPGKGFPKVR